MKSTTNCASLLRQPLTHEGIVRGAISRGEIWRSNEIGKSHRPLTASMRSVGNDPKNV
jgi:hypothetical protein